MQYCVDTPNLRRQVRRKVEKRVREPEPGMGPKGFVASGMLRVTAEGFNGSFPSDASLLKEANRHVSGVTWELCSDAFKLLPHGRSFPDAALLEIPLRANAKRAIRQRRRFVLLNKANDSAPWEVLTNGEHGLLAVFNDVAKATKTEFCYVQIACEEAEPPEQQELPETVESLEPEPEDLPEAEPEDENVHLNTVIEEGVPVQLRQPPRVRGEHAYFSVYAPEIQAGISFKIDVWTYERCVSQFARELATDGGKNPLGSDGNQLEEGTDVRFELVLDETPSAYEIIGPFVQEKKWTSPGPMKVSFAARCLPSAEVGEYQASIHVSCPLSADKHQGCSIPFRLKVEPSSRPITPPKRPILACTVTGPDAAEAQRENPRWVADTEAVRCMCCQIYFGRIWGRKHHCRCAGSIVTHIVDFPLKLDRADTVGG
jgi:hypothetical protein